MCCSVCYIIVPVCVIGGEGIVDLFVNVGRRKGDGQRWTDCGVLLLVILM